jgi:hypothetical protein
MLAFKTGSLGHSDTSPEVETATGVSLPRSAAGATRRRRAVHVVRYGDAGGAVQGDEMQGGARVLGLPLAEAGGLSFSEGQMWGELSF